MTSIWKFSLEVKEEQAIRLPTGAKIMSVQVQHERPVMWALVDPLAPVEDHRIWTYGTGQDVRPSERGFIGTYQLAGGHLAFHVFDGGSL